MVGVANFFLWRAFFPCLKKKKEGAGEWLLIIWLRNESPAAPTTTTRLPTDQGGATFPFLPREASGLLPGFP